MDTNYCAFCTKNIGIVQNCPDTTILDNLERMFRVVRMVRISWLVRVARVGQVVWYGISDMVLVIPMDTHTLWQQVEKYDVSARGLGELRTGWESSTTGSHQSSSIVLGQGSFPQSACGLEINVPTRDSISVARYAIYRSQKIAYVETDMLSLGFKR